MALSRSARRAVAKQRKAAKLERLAKRAIAERNMKVNAIVRRNLSGPKPARTPNGLTQASVWQGNATPLGKQKHCEAKQKVTVHGKDLNLARIRR